MNLYFRMQEILQKSCYDETLCNNLPLCNLRRSECCFCPAASEAGKCFETALQHMLRIVIHGVFEFFPNMFRQAHLAHITVGKQQHAPHRFKRQGGYGRGICPEAMGAG